jgi:hypothetical protein
MASRVAVVRKENLIIGPVVARRPARFGSNSASWRQHHHHLPAFEAGFALDLGDFLSVALDPEKQVAPELLVRHLTPTKPQRDLHLVAFVEEAHHRLHLNLIVVIINVRSHLDFFDFDSFLLLTRLGGFLLFLIFEFAVIENLSDGRVRIRRDLDEVEPRFPRAL